MPRWWPVGVALIAGVMMAPAGSGQETVRHGAAAVVRERVIRDFKVLLPQRQERPSLFAGVAGVFVLPHVDRGPSRAFAKRAPGELTSLEPWGRFGVGHGLGASFLAVGVVSREKSVVSRGVALVEANLLASWVVEGVQSLTVQARPWQAHAGQFGRGGRSFP